MVAIVIVPSALKVAAEFAVKQLAPHSEGESFTVALRSAQSPVATEPTHWACVPIISNEISEQIRNLLASPPFTGMCECVTCTPDEALAEFRVLLERRELEPLTLVEVES